jgi:hypothetical protein
LETISVHHLAKATSYSRAAALWKPVQSCVARVGSAAVDAMFDVTNAIAIIAVTDAFV